MPTIKIGCAGWVYEDWIGPFYPDYVSKERFLTYYAKHFDIVEINSSHYNIPKEKTIKKWRESVPHDFRFCIKFWNQITHISDHRIGIQNLHIFLNAFQPLIEKIAYYLIQFPPSFRYDRDNFIYIHEILDKIDPDIKVSVELRHNTWFDLPNMKSLLNGKNQILGTIYLNDIIPYYPEWQKNYYIRVIGDRNLKKFDRVQRTIPEIWNDLTSFIKQNRENTKIDDIFVIFNNHYSGFSPADSNMLKSFLDLPIKDFKKKGTITDFF
ncbi:MAG: DUF72 domain-containing protein [Candidatus Lokiarchaeota archaeon]|nr:DUF72 domain-containing protein [Candidatus Lokiarchaeota archaeon]